MASIAQLILATPNGEAKLVAMVEPRTTIGRDTVNDVVIESALASRRHAVLLTEGPFVLIADSGSRNGTYVNGCRVKTQVLADRDLIEVGDCLMRFLAFGQEVVSVEAIQSMSAQGAQLYRPGVSRNVSHVR